MAVSISRRAALSAAIAALSGGLAAIVLDAPSQASPQAPELPVVKVRAPQRQFVNDWQEYSGRLEAVEQVEIRPRVEGTLLSVHFRDGQLVREGDLLFTIDPAPFEAELKRAQAVLAQAQDRQRYTAGELERGRRLLAANAAAKRDVDALENAAREARSATQAALAAVERARLDVGYARIRAPITGRISRPEVTAGNVVKAGGDAMPLAAIVTLDPLYAAFHADEHTYLRYFGGRAGDESVQVQVGLAGEEGFPHAGRLYSVDNRLDTRSGTIRMRALVDNADGRMIPGLQARIRIQASSVYPAVLVDETAIGTDQDRRYVLVVDGEGHVQYRQLELGSRQGRQRVVRAGLAPGDRIIVEGAGRVRPGDRVQAVVAALTGEEQAP
jgi:multidrug efflux system membrane fusion protein